MPPQFYETEITHIQQLTHNVKDLTFTLKNPTEIEFLPGQFVTLLLKDSEEKPVSRAYSIASDPAEKNAFHLCIKIVKGGKGTAIIDTLKVGDTVKLFGPSGHFLFNSKTKSHIFIGTGTGVAPFIPMIEHALKKDNSKDDFQLIFGVRAKEDLLYEDKWMDFEKEFPNFKCHMCLSREELEGHFFGRVTACLKESITDHQNHDFYICGVGEMVNDVIEMLVNHGVSDEQIHYERYS